MSQSRSSQPSNKYYISALSSYSLSWILHQFDEKKKEEKKREKNSSPDVTTSETGKGMGRVSGRERIEQLPI